MSALLLQRRSDHAQTKRTIFTYSFLVLVPLLATLLALPPGVLLPASPLWRWAPLIVLPLAFLAFYRLIDWLYTRRIEREAQQLEQMKTDLQETIAEYKEKTNFAEMIRKMAGYEQAANASLFMPLPPAPTQVVCVRTMYLCPLGLMFTQSISTKRDPLQFCILSLRFFQELFTPHKAGGARVAFTPAGGAAASSLFAPITPRASQAALTAAESRKAPATGTRRSLSATDLSAAAQTPAHHHQRPGSLGGIAENSGPSGSGAGACAIDSSSNNSSSGTTSASLESLQHELQAARAQANAAQRDAEAMRHHALKSQTALQQLATLQMQGNAAHAGPNPQAAALMVAGGLTAADVQQLKQNTGVDLNVAFCTALHCIYFLFLLYVLYAP